MHAHPTLDWQEVSALVGPIEDDKVAAIVISGATLEQVAEAKSRLATGDRPADGPAAKVYDLLATSSRDWRER